MIVYFKWNIRQHYIIMSVTEPIKCFIDRKFSFFIFFTDCRNCTSKNKRYIFNLGHGVLPHTKIKNVEKLVNFVKNY